MKKTIRSLVVLFVLLFTLTSCGVKEDAKTGMTIVDITGNEVNIEKPLEKVLIQGSGSGGPFMTMMALDRDTFADKIIAMDDGISENRNDLWKRLVDANSDLDKIQKIGDISKNEVSPEEILNINPDGIIAPISYKASLDEISKKINIPVIYVDYHDQDLEKHLKSTEIIAKATGLEKNLDGINTFYNEKVGNIIERAKKIEKNPRVYVEIGYSGPSQYDNTYGINKMWGRIIEDTAGENIMRNVLDPDDAKPVNPEYVLNENPEIILITGAIWKEMPDSMKLGFDIKEEDVQKKLEEYVNRQGWRSLDAVKNKNVYAVAHAMCRDMTDFYSYEVLAKIFHADEFKDIDPDKDIKEYYEKFMPIDFEGTWLVKYE
ncbi:ABC transporter substrate-binding protein [Peptoniphilus stercorisuis]|uniref:Iron complex transport system substrate-binding protein n=1 Tax=Peptoniphilus stercorisuis TaxID=1436965 RepID=A0ABS4KCV2_9FIRM|nr:ABC transporter substrate-binding protein [Peptoniphilus stercorisuis]MBP2025603.1 iron complex transport system substrate-binding protein [Peptoniphilus stercorisuis]